MTTEQYFNEFISFMGKYEEIVTGKAFGYYRWEWDSCQLLPIYEDVKHHLVALYLIDIGKTELTISDEELNRFNEIWADIHRIIFNYCGYFNKKKRPSHIPGIQNFMAKCFVHTECDKHQIGYHSPDSTSARFSLSPGESKRYNYITFNLAYLYDAMPVLVKTKKSIAKTMEQTGNDLSFTNSF